jgi:uncharacterized membrane protein
MERMIVVVFNSEGEAYEGARALNQLDLEGSIAVNAVAVVHKAKDGTLSTRELTDSGPIGAVTGTAVGALIGALGGPVGLLVGGAVAGLVGGAVDLENAGVGFDYLDDVSQALTPGTTAVVADVIEEWVTPLDTRMEQLGGIVIRRSRVDIEAAQYERDVAALQADMDALEAEIATANAEAKAKLNARLEDLKAKRAAAVERAKAKAEAVRREGDAKIKALQDKAKNSKAEFKQKQQERIANLQSTYQQRVQELQDTFR